MPKEKNILGRTLPGVRKNPKQQKYFTVIPVFNLAICTPQAGWMAFWAGRNRPLALIPGSPQNYSSSCAGMLDLADIFQKIIH